MNLNRPTLFSDSHLFIFPTEEGFTGKFWGTILPAGFVLRILPSTWRRNTSWRWMGVGRDKLSIDWSRSDTQGEEAGI